MCSPPLRLYDIGSGAFHAVAGVNDYSTERCSRHHSYKEAVDYLAQTFRLRWWQRWLLRYEGYVTLNRKRSGVDFCYIIPIYPRRPPSRGYPVAERYNARLELLAA